jgi:hypothetical protein
MATAIRPQAISGVSSQVENVVMTVYPSIAAWGPGQLVGMLSDLIPLKLGSVKLSHLLIAPILAPLAALLYFAQKVFGSRYVLTNRSVQSWAAMGERMNAQAPLTEIAEIEIERRAGQAFFHAADLVVRNAAGDVTLRLEGVVRPDVFRQTILEARDARIQTEASLATIQKRRPA